MLEALQEPCLLGFLILLQRLCPPLQDGTECLERLPITALLLSVILRSDDVDVGLCLCQTLLQPSP